MKRDEIRSRILQALNENPDDPQLYTNTQLNAIINDAGETIAEEAKAIRRSVDITLRPGHAYYYTRSIAPDIMVPLRLWIPTKNRRLVALSESNLDDWRERPHLITDTPWNWFPVSWDMFGVWPTSVAGGEILRVDYLAWPDELMSDADAPEFNESTHTAYYLYGVVEGLLKRWDYERAVTVFAQFMEMVGDTTTDTGMRQMQMRLHQEKLAGSPSLPTQIAGNRYAAS